MFYPILNSAQLYEERPREHLDTWHATWQDPDRKANMPTRWDYFLLRLGNLLIISGQRVREGSAVAGCSDAKVMRVKPSGGSA